MNVAGIKATIIQNAQKCVDAIYTPAFLHPRTAIAAGIALAVATFAAGRYIAPKCCGGKCDHCQ